MKKRHFVLSSIALGLSVFGATFTAQANVPSEVMAQNSLAPMLEKVQPAVVTISVEGKAKTNSRAALPDDIPEEFKFFFGDRFADQFGGGRGDSGRNFRGLGSGVIINADKGYVLTNNHVVDGADKITVQLQDGREFKGKLLGKDEQSDIALVQIEKPSNLTAIKFADSDKLRVGDFTVAIGNPFGLGQTVTSGIVSALGRSTGSGNGAYENYIQTDAAVNRGNSGGALVNLNGELIGINTAIISPSGGNAGIAFAIPSNQADNIVQQILEFGHVRRGLLGIKGGELNADLAKAFKVDAQKGAFVSEVLPKSAAEKAGLKAGDVITAINGQKISSFAEMRAKIATSGAGKAMTLTYLRDGKSHDTQVTLQADDGKMTAATELPALDGATLSNYDAKGVKGIEISKVQPNSLAAQRGLKSGDIIIGVNREPVQNTEDLRKVLESEPSAIALNILRGNSNFYLLVQ